VSTPGGAKGRGMTRRAAGMPELPDTRLPVWLLGAARLGNQTFDRQIFPNNPQLRCRYPAKIRPSTRALGIRPGEQKRLDKGVKKAGSRHNTNGLNGQRLKVYA
jgi:hypothetical protein